MWSGSKPYFFVASEIQNLFWVSMIGTIETQVEVWEQEKFCGNTGAGECVHSVFDSQTLPSVSIAHKTQT